MKRNIFLFLFIFYVLISTTLFINDTTYASPPWLTVGFYAKYSIVNAEAFISDKAFDYNANGTLFWKVEKIEGNYALIKINISIVGKVGEMTDNFSRTFHLLVDVNSRFILNTTKDDPFYFIYWIPIGTKANETTFIGHLRQNLWIVGTFLNCYSELQVKTNWKNFCGDDLIYLHAENESSTTSVQSPIHITSETYHPDFIFLYDRKTGLLIQIDGQGDPLLQRFLGILIGADLELKDHILEYHFTNGTVKTRKFRDYILIDSIGNEPVYESSKNESSKVNEVHSILISSFLAPPKIEAGKEFELSVTILNNGTVDENNLSALLQVSNESIKFEPSEGFLVNDFRSQETKELKWKITLPSEGKYILDFKVVRNGTTFAQKTFIIKAEAPIVQKIFPLVFSLFAFFLIAVVLLKYKSNKSRKR